MEKDKIEQMYRVYCNINGCLVSYFNFQWLEEYESYTAEMEVHENKYVPDESVNETLNGVLSAEIVRKEQYAIFDSETSSIWRVK